MGQVQVRVQAISEIQGEPRTLQDADVTVTGGKVPRVHYLGIPAAPTTTGIGASIASNAASNVITVSASPVVPRNLAVAFAASWDGGDIVAVGTNQFDEVITETIAGVGAGGTTVVGNQAFKTVTSLAKTAVGATTNAATVGMGSKLGIPARFTGAYGIHFVTGVGAAATFDPLYCTVLATALVPDASRAFTVIVNC